MNNPLFRGSATALITPFENGKVDLPALRRMVEMQIEGTGSTQISRREEIDISYTFINLQETAHRGQN